MKSIVSQLRQITDKYSELLRNMDEELFSIKPAPNKWSPKEELGHLIDSALNNHRRFVVSQYELNPKIVYDQEVWVRSGNYQERNVKQLIALWEFLNNQICETLDSMTDSAYDRTCDTGKKIQELHSLNWLAEDYFRHMKHHLHHILKLEAIPY